MRNGINIFSTIPGDVASAASHNIGTSSAIENFEQSFGHGHVASAASHDIVARDLRLKVFFTKPLEIMRGSLGAILALTLWLKKLLIILGNGASAASHDIGASNATENYEQFREMLRGVLVTMLAWETRMNVFKSSLRCCKGHWSQYGREKRDWKFFNNPGKEVIWRNEVTSHSRYHAVFLRSLCIGREKMSSRSSSGKFFHRVRPETYYWHPCQCFKTKTKANSGKLTVPDGFVLRPREPAYFTNDSGMKWQKSKL